MREGKGGEEGRGGEGRRRIEWPQCTANVEIHGSGDPSMPTHVKIHGSGDPSMRAQNTQSSTDVKTHFLDDPHIQLST